MQPALGLGLGTRINGYGGSFGGGFTIENSFYLDGVDEYFNADSLVANVSSDTVGTISVVTKSVNVLPTSAAYLFSFTLNNGTNAIYCWHRTDGKIEISAINSGAARFTIRTTNAIDLTSWTKIDFVQDGVQPVIYVNGVAVAQSNISAADLTFWLSDTTFNACSIGALYYNSVLSYGYNGYISQVSYLNTNLSQAQITDFYNNGNPKNPQSLFRSNCKYFFNPDNSGDTAQFSVVDSVNSITATSVNMEDADKTPLTPYTDPLQRIIDKYATLNAWSFEDFEIIGTTSTIYDYEGTHDLTNPAVANQPTFYGGDGNILNRPSAYFVTDDYLYKAQADYLIGQSTGCIHAVFTTNADVTNYSYFFASSEEASSNKKVYCGVQNGKIRVVVQLSGTASERYHIYADTTPILANTSYVVSVYQNGTTLQVLINGVAQSLTVILGTADTWWFSNITDRVNISIGALIQSSPGYSDLDIALIQITSDSADATVLANHTELNDIYGCYLTAEAPLSIEKSFYFDGVDQYFNADSLVANVSSDTVGTLSAMVRPISDTPSGNQRIVCFGDTNAIEQISFFQSSTGLLRVGCDIGGVAQWLLDTNSPVFSSTEWTKIDVVHDGVEPKIYINGVAVAQSFTVATNKTKWLNDATGIDNFSIGARRQNSITDHYFNGYISQVSYVNTNLSPQDIAYIYNSGDVRNTQTLLGNKCKFFWNPDNRTGDTAEFTVADSINSINATSVNFDDANLSPLTPYSDAIQTIIDKYATLNAWSFANIGINGTTTTAYDYEGTHDLSNPAVANQPTFVGGDANIDNYPSATFLTSEYLYKSTADYLSGQSTGCIHTVFTTNADVTTINRFVSSSDEATILYRIDMLILNGKLRFSMVNNTNSYIVDCDTTTLSGNTSYVVSAYQNGTTLQILINGVTQSLTVVGGTSQTYWFSNIPNRDNIVIGALIASSSFWSNLDIALVQITSDSDDATVLANHNELKTLYGI